MSKATKKADKSTIAKTVTPPPLEPALEALLVELAQKWEIQQATKGDLARFEKLKDAAKEIWGPEGNGRTEPWAIYFDGKPYQIEVIAVPKEFTERCVGCPGVQVDKVQMHLKVRRMVLP